MRLVTVDGSHLSLEQLVAVSRFDATVRIDRKSLIRTETSRRVLERLASEDHTIYGVNTGFGALSNMKIKPENYQELQTNLIRSHATSVGNAHSREIVRAIMLLRANTLIKGNSGVRTDIPKLIVSMLNHRIHPYIPEKGSVGASGDLSPLSHMALPLIGEGKAEYNGRWISGKSALNLIHEKPVVLQVKEGLALNNGTQQMLGIGCICLQDGYDLLITEIAALALALEAINGWLDAFDERIHQLRPHPGQVFVANYIRKILAGSRLARVSTNNQADREKNQGRPQDPYSFRCAAQVLGASKDALEYAGKVFEIEMNSATDNPLLFASDRTILSGGNFHGQPVSMALDIMALALSNMANISERRTSAIMDPTLNNGLPAFLVGKDAQVGLSSGLMAVQYTAAALVAENKLLTHPASSDSIPTSSNFEDFVSMGPGAAHKAMQVLKNSQYVVAIELLTAAQGISLRGEKRLAKGTRTIYNLIRRHVQSLDQDRSTHYDIEKIHRLIIDGKISDIARSIVS